RLAASGRHGAPHRPGGQRDRRRGLLGSPSHQVGSGPQDNGRQTASGLCRGGQQAARPARDGVRNRMTLDFLYPLITEAIRRAETLEDLRGPGARSAHLDVALLEEEIAEVLPASDPEGALARRGAVRAALAAREIARAQQLAAR